MPEVKTEELDLTKETFKNINTVGEMYRWLHRILTKSDLDANTPIRMYSDEEGNAINKILCLQCELMENNKAGIVLVPWEEDL